MAGAETPSGRGRGGRRVEPGAAPAGGAEEAAEAPEKRRSVSWARRLKRVFQIDVERCVRCGGQVKVIAALEDPAVIDRILTHLGESGESGKSSAVAVVPRGPPVLGAGI